VTTQAEHEHSVLADLLARMKRDGLITQTAGGDLNLRSYGRDVLVLLRTIRDHETGGDDE